MKITEGIDYYFNEEGKMVLTAHYLRNRGYCCGNGCLHCPFAYQNVPQPKKKALLDARSKTQEKK